MRLLLDEHHHPDVASRLRGDGCDVVALADLADVRGSLDAEVLRLAVDEHRALVTENIRDFVPLHRTWIERGDHHYGVLLTASRRFPRGPEARGRLVAALAALLSTHPAEDALRDLVIWL